MKIKSTIKTDERKVIKFTHMTSALFVVANTEREIIVLHLPGDSIQPVDPTGNDRIRRIPYKTDRTRLEFHRIPN
jgi:hypothetical protein